jgi:hypothetical protein
MLFSSLFSTRCPFTARCDVVVHMPLLFTLAPRAAVTCDFWPRSWDTPFPLIHERFYIPDYLRVFEGIKATMEY